MCNLDEENSPGQFTQTHWSLVRHAACSAGPDPKEALEELCRRYWPPIFGFIRRRGFSEHDAQDLTQDFFARILRKGTLSKADPALGRFRTFLLADLEFMLKDASRHGNRQKRFPGEVPVSLSAMQEEESRFEPASAELSPAEWFDRRWRIVLIERGLARLQAEFEAAGKGRQLEELRRFLTDDVENGDYAKAAEVLDVPVRTLPVIVHRMRGRFRELVRHEVRQTVDSEQDLDREIGALLLP